jgi:hypothetical protein
LINISRTTPDQNVEHSEIRYESVENNGKRSIEKNSSFASDEEPTNKHRETEIEKIQRNSLEKLEDFVNNEKA